MTRTPLAALVVALALIGCGTTAERSVAATTVGIGDQGYDTFTNQLFSKLKVKRTRIFVPWNVALKRRDRRYLDSYLAVAHSAHVEVLVAFNTSYPSRCPRRPCRLPSVKAYTKAFKAFRKRYPKQRLLSPWNEANHRSQPTFRNPKRAAQFYKVIRKRCRRCRIVAADVIDESNMVAWLKVFKRYARGARLWGLHNYKDTNPRRGQIFGGTRKMLRTVRGQVWLTETGGIVKFVLPNHRTLFRSNERRANRALKRTFRLAKRYRRRIKRLYIYQWKQPRRRRDRFDAGLIRRSGKARPGYFTVKRNLALRSFNP
jgi:hypothetical protein